MLPRLSPLGNIVKKYIGGRVGMIDAAVGFEVEEQAVTEPALRPIFTASQLEKVTAGVPGHQSLSDEVALLSQMEVRHPATIRYLFKNCLVHDAGFDTSGYSFRKRKLRNLRFLTAPVEALPTALYAMTGVIDEYFGHWLRDGCPMALLARQNEPLLLDVRRDWPHASDYVKALSLKPSKSDGYSVDSLYMYQDHGLGPSKQRRFQELRQRLKDAYPDTHGTQSEAIYFRRGHSGNKRLIANESAMTDMLLRRNFEVVDLEGSTVEELQTRFRQAKLVISVDGSHINHLYFSMPKGATLITLVPSDRFTMTQIGCCQMASLAYGFVVIEPSSGGYKVSLDELNRIIDRV